MSSWAAVRLDIRSAHNPKGPARKFDQTGWKGAFAILRDTQGAIFSKTRSVNLRRFRC
jgi:hypothetical protein